MKTGESSDGGLIIISQRSTQVKCNIIMSNKEGGECRPLQCYFEVNVSTQTVLGPKHD